MGSAIRVFSLWGVIPWNLHSKHVGRLPACTCLGWNGTINTHIFNPFHGHLYRRELHISDAIIAYQQAILLDPGNTPAHSARMVWSCQFGKDDWSKNPEYCNPGGYYFQVM
jgi:hypothetical protein